MSCSSSAVPSSGAVTLASEQQFYQKLLSSIRLVTNYLKPGVLEKARLSMPLAEMKERANNPFHKLNNRKGDANDQLLIELLAWFKESFFHWMDSPPCSGCGGTTSSAGYTSPNPEEVAHLATRVEQYRCQSCGNVTRFPRYNDPCHLLETRVGRCGEWANCFTMLCLAAGFEARYVLDWTDHVWTEVYSTGQQRWIHADPCENECDRPLLYEVGWNKKLTYVIAFSPFDIQDVTWRYTANPDEVLARRTECREVWLATAIVTLRQILQQQQLQARRLTHEKCQELIKRTAVELVELMQENKSDASNLGGRTTGSDEWRRARGEIGNEKSNFKPFIIIPTASETDSGVIEVKYSVVQDEYIRVSDDMRKTSGFQNMAFDAASMFRKEERDWKMVYLARQPKSDSGSLSWKIDISHVAELYITSMEIKITSKCFESGQVSWMLCTDDTCISLKESDNLQSIQDVRGRTVVTLKAVLSGGVGENAWQHAQLFRQSLSDTDTYSFHICLHFAKRTQ